MLKDETITETIKGEVIYLLQFTNQTKLQRVQFGAIEKAFKSNFQFSG